MSLIHEALKRAEAYRLHHAKPVETSGSIRVATPTATPPPGPRSTERPKPITLPTTIPIIPALRAAKAAPLLARLKVWWSKLRWSKAHTFVAVAVVGGLVVTAMEVSLAHRVAGTAPAVPAGISSAAPTPQASAQPSPRAPAQTAAPARPRYTAAQTAAAASNFKVTAILSGPNGDTALINGQMVFVGQSVSGARLVSASPNAVQLEMDGLEFTVAMHP